MNYIILSEGKISTKTIERVAIAKSYIEKKYKMKKLEEDKKKEEWDLFNKKLMDYNLPAHQKDSIKQELLHKEAENLRQS
jgi:hypothetical protein